MHRRGQRTTFQERILISEQAEAGHTDRCRLLIIWAKRNGRYGNGDVSLSTKDVMA